MKGRLVGCAILSVWLVMLATRADAYIDPGSGTLLLQLVLSGFAGALFMARKTIGRVFKLITGRQAIGASDSAGPEPHDRQ